MGNGDEIKRMILAERCIATHDAIRGGRTDLKSRGCIMNPDRTRKTLFYICPHCGATVTKEETTA